MSVDWSYYNKFVSIKDKYLPVSGEGETRATQIITAVSKLVYKWYNDGDVFDNTYHMNGWCNDLSSYANWLDKYANVDDVLGKISECYTYDDYEDLLKELTDITHDEVFLYEQDKMPKIDSIYTCKGRFKFVENNEDDEWY